MILIAGPCVIESPDLVDEIANRLKEQLSGLDIDFYFKASFDKANRTSADSFRGPGLEKGLQILEQVRDRYGFRILTDVHLPEQAHPVAEVVDALQIPAFLCRQTDLIEESARAALKFGRKLNVKKGQFLAPWDAGNIVAKGRRIAEESGQPSDSNWFWLTERGTSFGYNNLVVDMSGIQQMQRFDVPVIYDATHSVQTPGGKGTSTGGKRESIEVLARAAVAAGADGVFMETHPRPDEAKSDGPNAFYLEHAGEFVRQLLAIQKLVSSQKKLLPEAQ